MGLPTEYQDFIALSRYARWLPEEGRRESWEETVDRYINFMYTHAKETLYLTEKDLKDLYDELGATCDP